MMMMMPESVSPRIWSARKYEGRIHRRPALFTFSCIYTFSVVPFSLPFTSHPLSLTHLLLRAFVLQAGHSFLIPCLLFGLSLLLLLFSSSRFFLIPFFDASSLSPVCVLPVIGIMFLLLVVIYTHTRYLSMKQTIPLPTARAAFWSILMNTLRQLLYTFSSLCLLLFLAVCVVCCSRGKTCRKWCPEVTFTHTHT